MKKNITGVNTVLVIFYVKRTFMGYACQMNVKYATNISEIMKNYKIKKSIYFFILYFLSLNLKPLKKKANQTLIDYLYFRYSKSPHKKRNCKALN